MMLPLKALELCQYKAIDSGGKARRNIKYNYRCPLHQGISMAVYWDCNYLFFLNNDMWGGLDIIGLVLLTYITQSKVCGHLLVEHLIQHHGH